MFYEAPHRIMKTLESLKETFENETIPVNWNITGARELTKMIEEVVQGTPSEVLQYFIDHPDKVRGEFVVMVSEPAH